MIYKCKVYFSDRKIIEVEASCPERAEEKARDIVQDEYSPDLIDRVDVWESACQYSDQQELEDRERNLE